MKKNNNYLIVILICLFIFLNQNVAFTQISADSTEHNSFKSLAKTVGEDALHVFTTPFRMNSKDGLKLLALTAVATSVITLLDKPIDRTFVTEGENAEGVDEFLFLGKRLAKIGYAYDNIPRKYFAAGLSSSILLSGFIFRDKKLLVTTRIMIESFLISQAITGLGKGFFGRSRPYTEKGAYDFNIFKFGGKYEFRALPSGHTSGIFSMMTVIAKQYDKWWIKIPAYVLSVSVALQRIDDRQHWASDVIVGGALGYWVGSTLVNRNKNNSPKLSINPFLNKNQLGVTFNF